MSTKKLLPQEARTIRNTVAVADLVEGLPTLSEIRSDILALIDDVIVHLENLQD